MYVSGTPLYYIPPRSIEAVFDVPLRLATTQERFPTRSEIADAFKMFR